MALINLIRVNNFVNAVQQNYLLNTYPTPQNYLLTQMQLDSSKQTLHSFSVNHIL